MLTNHLVDRNSPQALYYQIYMVLKERVQRGYWSAGTQIPPEDELCRLFDVSKATVRAAVAELVREGFLLRLQGKGTFVPESLPYAGITMRTKLSEMLFNNEPRACKTLLEQRIRDIPQDMEQFMRAGGQAHYLLLRRSVDGEPAFFDETFIPLYAVASLDGCDIEALSIYELIACRSALHVQRIIQNIEMSVPRGRAAELLETAGPVLTVHRLMMGRHERPIAYTRLFGEGGKYKIQMEFERL